MDFEWDDNKADSNLKKHGVRFSEAVTVWTDESALEMHDPDHSDEEDRWIRLGYSNQTRILVVVFCERVEVPNFRPWVPANILDSVPVNFLNSVPPDIRA